MNLKTLINDFRNDNSKEKYSLMFQKIIDMYNNDEVLFLVGKIAAKDDGLEQKYISKTIENEVYLLVCTEDAELFSEGEGYSYIGLKVENMFNYLLDNEKIDGFVLNDNDGPGSVMVTKDLIQRLFAAQ